MNIYRGQNYLYKQFNYWKILACVGSNKHRQLLFLCKCMKCGIEKVVIGENIKRGFSSSCGSSLCSTRYKNMSESKRLKLKGQKFGKLTVIKFSHIEKNKSYFECKCECGGTKIVKGLNLKLGLTKSCGCLIVLPTSNTIFNRLFREYKTSAKNRNFEFKLTKKEVINLLLGDCVYCGSEPYNTKTIANGKICVNVNGIDRVDNKKGYILENCFSCCKRCNYMKHNYTVKEFKIWLKRLANKILERRKNNE